MYGELLVRIQTKLTYVAWLDLLTTKNDFDEAVITFMPFIIIAHIHISNGTLHGKIIWISNVTIFELCICNETTAHGNSSSAKQNERKEQRGKEMGVRLNAPLAGH